MVSNSIFPLPKGREVSSKCSRSRGSVDPPWHEVLLNDLQDIHGGSIEAIVTIFCQYYSTPWSCQYQRKGFDHFPLFLENYIIWNGYPKCITSVQEEVHRRLQYHRRGTCSLIWITTLDIESLVRWIFKACRNASQLWRGVWIRISIDYADDARGGTHEHSEAAHDKRWYWLHCGRGHKASKAPRLELARSKTLGDTV